MNYSNYRTTYDPTEESYGGFMSKEEVVREVEKHSEPIRLAIEKEFNRAIASLKDGSNESANIGYISLESSDKIWNYDSGGFMTKEEIAREVEKISAAVRVVMEQEFNKAFASFKESENDLENNANSSSSEELNSSYTESNQ